MVAAYLARRLGIAPEDVPLPRTPSVGWTALPYFDPSPPNARRNARPRHVGDFPCAVFGTAASDGGRHAHRIYLAPAGAGKAELGTSSSGQPRDSKKSAKAADGDNTAGRAVLWGDPECAPWLILCEGIETGTALAHVLAREIETAALVVAAAVSASGVEAFRPYARTERIIVAADRDEAPKPDGKPGSQRGERAARRYALHHHERLKIAIAMPGSPGEGVDFVDVLRRNGAGAVRAAIEGAQPFSATRAELEEQAIVRDRTAELTETSELYPLPELDNMELVYHHTESGRVKVHKSNWERSPDIGHWEKVLTPVATPMGVPGRLRHADRADAYGLRVAVQDMNDCLRVVDVDRAPLAKRGAPDVLTLLFAAGLRTELDGEAIALQCLKAAHPDRQIVVLRRPGWHKLPGLPNPFFIGPDGTVIGAPNDRDLELAATARLTPDDAMAGSLDGWRAAVRAAMSVAGSEHWTLGVIAAFAGPVVSLAGLDTCGINLSGISTSGKSTAQRLAAAAWSTPDIRRPGLNQSARATDNGIESLAHRATGTVLSLDELAHVNGKELARIIYMVAGGVGKKRMNAEAVVRDSYTWSTFAILSGESSLAEKVTRDGGAWSAGMAVRIVDVDVTDVNRRVDAATLARIEGIERHYGHAGPTFVRALIEAGLHRQGPALRERVLSTARVLAGEAVVSQDVV